MDILDRIKTMTPKTKQVRFGVQSLPYETQKACWDIAHHIIKKREPRLSIRETVALLREEYGFTFNRSAFERYLQGIKNGEIKEPKKETDP